MTFRKTLLLLAVTCSLVQIGVAEYNLSLLGDQTLLTTTDSPSYINPAKNFLDKGVWKDNFSGATSYVQRAPFYGALYLVSDVISSNALLTLKVIQYVLMFTGIYFFGKMVYRVTHHRRLAVIATLCFGLLPFFHGFVGYVMTEAIAPYLLILLTYFFVRSYFDQKHLILFILVGSAIVILRVQLIVFPLLFVIMLLIKHKRKMGWTVLVFLPFLFWQWNVKNTMGSFQLHPIYSYTNKTIFRPPHQSLTELFRTWEHDGEKFHRAESILRKDTSNATLNKALSTIPGSFRKQVSNKLKLYQQVAFQQQQMWAQNENRKLEIESIFVTEIEKWNKTKRKIYFMQEWVKTPFMSLKHLMKSSHLNHYIFQKTLRGNFFVEALRILAVIITVFSVVASVLLIFIPKVSILIRVVMTSFLVSLLYLVFFQRMNETRYMAPYLPIIFTGFWVFCNQFRKRIKKPIV